MLKELIKIAGRLDALGHYDLADELDVICREAAEKIDLEKVRELMREMNIPLRQLEGEDDPDEERYTPDERLPKLFPGKNDERDPDELSEEDVSGEYLEKRVEDIEDQRDPLVGLMESIRGGKK